MDGDLGYVGFTIIMWFYELATFFVIKVAIHGCLPPLAYN